MFEKILVANRGEIALRVMRTAHEMGIKSVAVFSDADKEASHVTAADEAVCLGASEPAASYLDIDKVIAAAKQTGAKAIHPGYGFLAENAGFALRVASEGLVFVGPPGEVLARVGDKITARRLMADIGLPVIPGMSAASSDLGELEDAADRVGYPVLVKATAGGGGKGMRVASRAADLPEAVHQATSEAAASFGDGSIYLEKFLPRPRHVEFQILADTWGNVVHLFERECSIQRRHQKIIEETPSPALDDALRERMGQAAVAAARAAGYVNAGTVEFLLEDEGSFYFLEVNARLQVEHPVTELTTSLDLVRCQLEIAAGAPLPFRQEELSPRGHAIECRIYAEDPEHGFLPSPGRILLARSPEGPGIRFDHGVFSGADVPVYYDPILGKLVAYAQDRQAAISRMLRALRECVVLGVRTPVELLIDVLQSEAFRAGRTHTGFIEEHFPSWKPGRRGDHLALIGYLVDQMVGADREAVREAAAEQRTEALSPWQRLGGWRMG